MPPVQTSYSEYMSFGVLGQIRDSTPHEIVSRNVATVAGIQFGQPVFKGATDKTIVAAGTAGVGAANFEGFTVLSPVATPLFQATAQPGAPGFNVYPYQAEAAVMKRGTIVVMASVAVTPESVPAIDPATGNVTTVAANVAGSFQINAAFERTAAAGSLVTLRIH